MYNTEDYTLAAHDTPLRPVNCAKQETPELQQVGQRLEMERAKNRSLIAEISGKINHLSKFPPEPCDDKNSDLPVEDFKTFILKEVEELSANNRQLDRILSHLRKTI
jgi:hypothetical protein